MISREKELGLYPCKMCGSEPKILYTKKCFGLKGIKQIAVVCKAKKCIPPEWFSKEQLAIEKWQKQNKDN